MASRDPYWHIYIQCNPHTITTTQALTTGDECEAYRGFRSDKQRFAPLVDAKTGYVNQETAEFIRHYVRKWREKSLFQVLLHYRAARFQDFVNLCQQVHIYNQRVVAGLNKCTRSVPFDRINTKEVTSAQLGPMRVAVRKLPIRLDQIPFYDTQYMVDPVNSLARQSIPSGSQMMTSTYDEEAWDSPLQRNPSMTSQLLTYNAYKKEQACQTNWDRMGESDVIYNQNFYRDPHIMRRNQMQMQVNAYNNYNPNYNSYYNPNYNSSQPQRWGSRRNSLKSYPAPPPPPMPPTNFYRNDVQQTNRTPPQQNMRNSYPPPSQNPVQELQNMMGRRDEYDNEENSESPYNFKAMLRKTNYSRPDSNTMTYEFNSNNQQQQTFQPPKLRPTGRSFEEGTQFGGAAKFGSRGQQQQTSQTNTTSKSYEEASSSYMDGDNTEVTFTGDAFDI